MLKLFHVATLVLGMWQLAAADPVAPPEKIRFPVQQSVAPNPSPIGTLTADRLYVIDSDVPLIVLASPEGLVLVSEEPGPLRIRGKFIDGNGKTETRNYKGKAVFSIEAVSSGRVELLIVPVGSTKAADVIRKTIDVDAGDGPRPPPDPIDPPAPVVTSFRVIWIHESGATLPQHQISVMDAKSVRDYLNASTTKDGAQPGWRRWDRDINADMDFPAMKAFWANAKPKITTVPCVAIEVNGKADVYPFPASPADAIKLFRSKNGGK